MEWWFAGLGWLVFAAWAVALGPAVLFVRWMSLPRQAASRPEPEPPPLVSVIVAARDEERAIERTLRSLLQSDWPRLEVIAVDDRSRDATGAIMDRLAEDDARLHVVHVTSVPVGWLGKNHALFAGAERARGRWLLFTDGDVWFAPRAIRQAVGVAEADAVDHLCLVPDPEPGGFWENAVVAWFSVAFFVGTQPWWLRWPIPFSYVGVGAFNLVRAGFYRRMGGHRPIRMDVLDDVKLGKLVRRNKGRQRMLISDGAVSVRWQHSLLGVVRGLEKNAFGSLAYSPTALLALTAAFALFVLGPYVAIALRPDAAASGFFASVVLLHAVYSDVSARFGQRWRSLPVLPIAAVLVLFAFWRSALITLREGGVRWRETFYSLETLRAGRYR